VADHAVAQLKERGDPWRLTEEAPNGRASVNMKRLRFLVGWKDPRRPTPFRP
jgi:hypothetical protein